MRSKGAFFVYLIIMMLTINMEVVDLLTVCIDRSLPHRFSLIGSSLVVNRIALFRFDFRRQFGCQVSVEEDRNLFFRFEYRQSSFSLFFVRRQSHVSLSVFVLATKQGNVLCSKNVYSSICK